ncbi:uncharacterized protein LOC135494635 isoform X2 [Lineus longissimus]
MARYESAIDNQADEERLDDRSTSVVWTKKDQSCRDCCLFTLVVLAVILCVFFFLIVGPLLCILNMKRVTRVLILWFWLVMASIVIGMVLAFDVYTPVAIIGAGREQRFATQGLSTFMCKGVQIKAANHEITSYLFDGQPSIEDKKLGYSFDRADEVNAGDFQAYPFYVFPGSSVSFAMNTTSQVTFFKIKGHDNFTTWRNNYICKGGNCFDDFRTIDRDFQYNTSMDETDIYYVAFAKTKFNDPSPASIFIRFEVLRTVYNVTSAANACTGLDCTFDFRFMSNETVLLHVPVMENNHFETIETKCIPRDNVYLVAFFAGPLAFGIIVNLIIWFGCKRCEPEDENEVIPMKSGLMAAGDMARRYSTLSIGRTFSRRAEYDEDGSNLNKNIHINADSSESSWPA